VGAVSNTAPTNDVELQAFYDQQIAEGEAAYKELEAQGLSHQEIVDLWESFNPGERPELCGPGTH
jgi:hypothetical protein